ncbi:MAG: hypothetical protein ACM3UU_06195 [Ignavibacteriales bacterium]
MSKEDSSKKSLETINRYIIIFLLLAIILISFLKILSLILFGIATILIIIRIIWVLKYNLY